jgi:hypothetical protein
LTRKSNSSNGQSFHFHIRILFALPFILLYIGVMRTIAAITFLLCSSVVCQSQNPKPTAPPPTAAVEDIELNTALMESTFMIEGRGPQGTTLGTVFVIGRLIPNVTPEAARLVMVTAAHVLEEIPGEIATLHLRKKVDQKTNSWIPFPLPIQIRVNASVVRSKAANGGQVKTGQRMWPGT